MIMTHAVFAWRVMVRMRLYKNAMDVKRASMNTV